jgi:hypothetical protein
LLRKKECTPMVDEFDLGFAVWTKAPRSLRGNDLGAGTTVIDRETGRLSTWPSVPTEQVAKMYREQRHAIVAPVKTADPEVELWRNLRRRPTPTVAAHVTFDGRLIIAKGAKGDQELRHHPLVVEWLRSNQPGELVRGAERHAEIVALSDTLHEIDRERAGAGQPPVTLAEARAILRDRASFEAFHVRERGDKLAGERAEPCESCGVCLAWFALRPWEYVDAEVQVIGPQPVPQPDRFPDYVAWVLAEGGWQVESRDLMEDYALLRIHRVVKVAGLEHKHESFPAAVDALCDFSYLSCHRRGPGLAQRIRLFDLFCEDATHTADMLHDFGRLIGARLFPIGSEGDGEDPIAIDEHGRVFAFDQGGEWFLGGSLDQALVNLVAGGYTPRVRDDGTW